jgi:hypothetical protein
VPWSADAGRAPDAYRHRLGVSVAGTPDPNPSLSAVEPVSVGVANSLREKLGEARDWAAIFADTVYFARPRLGSLAFPSPKRTMALARRRATGLRSGLPGWWDCQHQTSSDRTPFSRMLSRVIGSPGGDRGRLLMPLLGRHDLGKASRLSRRRHFGLPFLRKRPGCSPGLRTYNKPCEGVLRALMTLGSSVTERQKRQCSHRCCCRRYCRRSSQ